MSLVIDCKTCGDTYITITRGVYGNGFTVSACVDYGNGLAGYPFISREYSTERGARRCFNDLIKLYSAE